MYKDALDLTTAELRNGHNSTALMFAAQTAGLSDFESVSWSERKKNQQYARLSGVMTTKSATKVRLVLQLELQGGKWKISELRCGDSGLFDGIGPVLQRLVPPPDQIQAMVKQQMSAFIKAGQAGDWSEFFNNASPRWKDANWATGLYSVLKLSRLDVKEIMELDPQFDDPPKLVPPSNHLVVQGRYATSPQELKFAMHFDYDSDQWKLSFLHFYVDKG